ncbi:hypothetical protein JA1_003187 [Spathaspora sp. JA1]|nr:hypothetical protein JA1_003187 [Spathaspora sp. JA1]
MTLTKYQRGDAIEGWNDMPTNMMLSSSNNSTTSVNSSISSRSKKRISRIGMNFNDPGTNSNNSIGGSSGANSPAGTTTGPVPIRGPPTPTPTNSAPPPPPRKTSTSQQQAPQQQEQPVIVSDISPQQVISLLDQTLELPLSLPERELQHYKTKLTQLIPNLTTPHLLFLNEILDQVLKAYKSDDSTSKGQIKADVVKYMLNQEGVSAWCSPLKKIVSSV